MARISPPFIRGSLVCAISLALAACQTTRAPEIPPRPAAPWPGASQDLSEAAARAQNPDLPDRARIYKGSGVTVKGQTPTGVTPPQREAPRPSGNVVLNFEGADLREVVRNILGDILNEAYTIDPQVGGQVTIRTTSGIPRDSLPATLEMLLRMNGATMVKEDTIWKVVPIANAVRGNVTPQLGGSNRPLPQGYSVQLVPLKYVGVKEMQKILEPFVRDQTTVRVDEVRNLLILTGGEFELRHLLDTIDMFDIDWMSGMSAGVFTLRNADVKAVMQEIDKLMGDKANSPLAGVLRIIPIERMNALLIISPNPHYLDEARKWIDRLDSGSGEGVRFYVYNLQNQRAERVGPLLQQAFTGRVTQPQTAGPPTVAPGTPAGQIVSPPAFAPQQVIPVQNPTPSPTAAAAAGALGAAAGAVAAQRAVATEGGGVVRNIQVVADKDQNTILIVATPSEYTVIEQALKKLDVPSRQVMIEVTIAEVTLTDELTFGVDWLFKGGAPSGRGSGGNFLSSAPFNPAVPLTPVAGATQAGLSLLRGFSYIINNANFPGGIQAVLSLLDSYGNTKVIANPHLAALDNQKATIKSGDRIPVNQQTLVGGTTNAVTTTAQYIDTGVLLQVTPHINDGGLVTLDVQAEVSNPGTPATAGDAPPISTRSVQTLVSVPSGRTMVMGGLISTTKSNKTDGLPLVDRVPILGGLFGKQDLKDNRTELVLFITPRVVDNELDNERVIQDLRKRMGELDRMFPPPKPGEATPARPPSLLEPLGKPATPSAQPAAPVPEPPLRPVPPPAPPMSPNGNGQPDNSAPEPASN
jgi:general secretion pathway protein D